MKVQKNEQQNLFSQQNQKSLAQHSRNLPQTRLKSGSGTNSRDK